MSASTIQANQEAERIAALEDALILDTPPDEEFDFLARLAAEVCGTTMAAIAFLDAERQFYKSMVGMPPQELTREESYFCQHVVSSGRALVVEDPLADERFRKSPLVTGGPEIRFYAGAPLRTRGGKILGALSVMGTEPRRLGPHELDLLQGLANQVATLVQRRGDEGELRLQANLLDQVPAGVVSSDVNRRITQWSRGAELMSGVPRSEAIGFRLDELGLIPEQSRELRRAIQARLLEGGEWEGEIEVCDRAGRTFRALLTNSAVLGARGEIVGFAGVIMDLTERLNIEKEVDVQAHLLDQVEAAVVAMDLDHRITHWNRGAEKLYGWSQEEATGRLANELAFVREGQAAHTEAVREQERNGTSWELEIEARHKDGRTFPAFATDSTLRDDAGTPTGFVGVSVDISERKRAEREARAAQLGTIKRLATAVEQRDSDTGEHIERIGDYAALIAEHLGMGPERVDLIRVSSTMHDVGKIGIPDEILQKPGELTDEEREAMQHHASIGHGILAGSGADMLALGTTIALTHHERFDGSGYPNGLKGDRIPLEGRIVAVADVFDALTSDRVYRKAFSVDEAIEIMAEGRGTQFDPAILDLLLENVEAFTSIPSRSGPD